MKKSIFIKIFSGYFLIAAILTLLILSFSFHSIRTYYISTLTDDLISLGTVLNAHIQPFLMKKDFSGMDSYVKDLDVRIHRRITVIDASGIVIADSENNPRQMENHAGRPEVMQALQGKTGTSIRTSTTLGEQMLYVALPLENNAGIPGVLRVSVHIKEVNSLLMRQKMSILRLTLMALLLSLLAAYIFTRSLSRPISSLSRAAQKVAAGDYFEKVYVPGSGELRTLADNFNHMTEQLSVSFATLSQQKEELTLIISSLQEGLCVIGPDERILLSNASFSKSTDGTQLEGRFYWEVIREPRFKEMMQQVKSSKAHVTSELERDGTVFLCSITPVTSRNEYIVVLHDITQIRKLETIKKDFVGNVSHELRTPLTAIKGYLETIDVSVKDENHRYIDIVRRHTDRLIRIVEDLLLLSELEDKSFRIEHTSIDILPFFMNVTKMFEQRLKETGLRLKITVEPGLPVISADLFKLEQMLINLLDNAIKYTEKGTITLRAGRTGNNLTIEVEDTGVGIPKEHLSRIFERFYVVDKSRSRTVGGTGLGLSIVKHIILLHNGSIDVSSEPGSGTCFSIQLPIIP